MVGSGVILTNLRVIAPSRKPVRSGDIFAMQIPNGQYVFGRVVEANLPREIGPMPGSNLLYVYAGTHNTMQPDLTTLVPSNLLFPPMFTNRLGWSRGYFKTVAHEPVQESDRVPGLCFKALGRFYELGWKVIPGCSGMCGEWGLASYRRMDDLVSGALGIPLVPVQEI